MRQIISCDVLYKPSMRQIDFNNLDIVSAHLKALHSMKINYKKCYPRTSDYYYYEIFHSYNECMTYLKNEADEYLTDISFVVISFSLNEDQLYEMVFKNDVYTDPDKIQHFAVDDKGQLIDITSMINFV